MIRALMIFGLGVATLAALWCDVRGWALAGALLLSLTVLVEVRCA